MTDAASCDEDSITRNLCGALNVSCALFDQHLSTFRGPTVANFGGRPTFLGRVGRVIGPLATPRTFKLYLGSQKTYFSFEYLHGAVGDAQLEESHLLRALNCMPESLADSLLLAQSSEPVYLKYVDVYDELIALVEGHLILSNLLVLENLLPRFFWGNL